MIYGQCLRDFLGISFFTVEVFYCVEGLLLVDLLLLIVALFLFMTLCCRIFVWYYRKEQIEHLFGKLQLFSHL